MKRPTYQIASDLIDVLDTPFGKRRISNDEARRIVAAVQAADGISDEELETKGFTPKVTAVKVFIEEAPADLEHDINEWMTDPDEHDGIVSVQYQVTAIPASDHRPHVWEFSALVHYVVKD